MNIIRDNMLIGEKLRVGKPRIQPTRGELFQKITDGFGHTILKPISSNTVVLGGAIAALEALTGVEASFKPNTLNDILNIPCGSAGGANRIALFAIGTGGCGLDFGSIKDESVLQNNVLDLIPMRYTGSVDGIDSSKYFMKKLNSDGTTYSWYCKEFDSTPVITSCWKNAVDSESDGTEITSDVADSGRTDGVESFAQFEIALNIYDGREYFENCIGNLSRARYNCIGFYTGEKVYDSVSDSYEYANVRLYSVVHFNNRSLVDASSSSLLYRVYSIA